MFTELHGRDQKPTEIVWAPSVPTDWKVTRNKAFLAERKEIVGGASASQQLLSLTKSGVIVRDMDNLEGKVPATFDGYQYLSKGDLIFCLFDIDETPRTVGLVTRPGMITSAYTRFQVRGGISPEFLAHYYTALDDRKALKPLYSGLRKSIRTDAFLAAHIPVPPPGEQTAIVKYLGHAHARIDRAVGAKRKLVGLLEEQKQRIIHEAVTRGLNRTTPLKDTAIPWLGMVPEHWELKPARRLLRAITRPVGDEALPRLSMTRERGLVRTDLIDFSSRQATDHTNFQTCIPGDFVLNKYRAHLGLFCAVREPGLVTRNYTNFRRVAPVHEGYLEALFQGLSYRHAFRTLARGVGDGMSPLYTSTFYGIPVLQPPASEQIEISQFIAATDDRYKQLQSRVRREIHLLLEFRARLTSDVVLGQVDVRGIAATLTELNESEMPLLIADSDDVELLEAARDVVDADE